MKGLFTGFSSYGQAYRLISGLRLWRYALAPAIISILLAIGIGLAAWGWSDDLGEQIVALYPWEKGLSFVESASDIIAAVLIVAIGFIVFKNLVLAFSSPFMSILSEKVERHLNQDYREVEMTVQSFVSDLIRGLRIALRLLVRELFYSALLILLGLIPIFSPFVAIALFLLQSLYAGYGNLDFVLERHGRVRESVQFLNNHKGLALGNGVIYLLMLMSIILFAVALPLATVAGTVGALKYLPAPATTVNEPSPHV